MYLLMGTCVVSGKRFVYFLKTKDETAEHILKAALEIQGLGGTLKIVKSDNGGEFVSGEFRRELLTNRITYETTSPHSPHQNGIAERSNRSQCELAVASFHACCQCCTQSLGLVGDPISSLPDRQDANTCNGHEDISSLHDTW
jgi:transposase InsO family protein